MILVVPLLYLLLFVDQADVASVLHAFEVDLFQVLVGFGSGFLMGVAQGGDASTLSQGLDGVEISENR